METALTPGTARRPRPTAELKPRSAPTDELVMMYSALIAWSMLLVAERDSEAPNTAMVETRASPTISAAAVCAVRRGLRIEFSRPRRPAIPSAAASGRPMVLAKGRATSGASIPTPTKMPTAPSPRAGWPGRSAPGRAARCRATVTAEPTTTRRRDDSATLSLSSVMAATGGMRTARRAGLMAEITVTPNPTTRAATTVRRPKTSEPPGSVKPKALRSFSSPTAPSTPRPSPTAEASSPTMAASASTERKTWPLLAPTRRSRASSRVRWPTMIEKVLKIVKPPTKSAMNANTKRAVEKKPRAWLMALACSLATVCPVTTSTPAGRVAAMARCMVALSAPGLASTSIASVCRPH